MCGLARCILQNSNGDCTLNSYPKNWICPCDAVECKICGGMYTFGDYCETCQKEENEDRAVEE
jgi:hypothetical protein